MAKNKTTTEEIKAPLEISELTVGAYYEDIVSGMNIRVLVARIDPSGEVLCRHFNRVTGTFDDFFACDGQLRKL